MTTKIKNPVSVLSIPNNDRTRELTQMFSKIFGKSAEFYVRVPGRVNLIGEHVDYCGYGVCPMALEQNIMIAISVEQGDKLRVHNIVDKYAPYEADINKIEIKVSEGAPQWHQYFLCGLKGIAEVLPKERGGLRAMNCLVSGNVPPGAGLSSSSALVSAAALATAYANKFEISREDIADLCAKCERYIGTQGGGMDQAIAFLATEGCAKFIQFAPLRTTDVVIPKGAVFVVAHSMVVLNKAATSDFNCRVVECRLGAQIIAKKQGLEWQKIKKLGDLQETLKLDFAKMISLVEKNLHDQPYTKKEAAEELGTTPNDLNKTSLTQNTKDIESFKLRQRALHVFQEAQRVEIFHETCSKMSEKPALEALGKLMTASHESLRDLYECSHPQLDTLVRVSRLHTLGCRLTGAGWGGCTVALVLEENVDKYISVLKNEFYKPLNVEKDFENILFVTAPNVGASVHK